MRTSIKISASLLGALLSFNALAQNCSLYIPNNEGATLVYGSYDKKDKLQTENTMKVASITALATGTQYNIESVVTNVKDDTKTELNYTMQCSGDKFTVDMKQFVAPGTVSSWQDVKVQATNLDYPKSISAGQALPDGHIVVDMAQPGVPMPMKVTVDIVNRKVVGEEKITTAAGTFNCYKITYDVNMKMMVKVAAKAAEWISPNVGVVRSESYDSNGKLTSYTILKSVTE